MRAVRYYVTERCIDKNVVTSTFISDFVAFKLKQMHGVNDKK